MFISNANIIRNIFRMQAFDSVMCEIFYIWFIGFIFKDKSLKNFTNLFLPQDFENNDKILN